MATSASARKPNATSQAEVVLLPALKNCLLNLPASLVGLLLNSNAVVQNVVVELSFKPESTSGAESKAGSGSASRSVFLGWTGMRSQTRAASLLRREGSGRPEQEMPTVEIDSTYGKLLGLTAGIKVNSAVDTV